MSYVFFFYYLKAQKYSTTVDLIYKMLHLPSFHTTVKYWRVSVTTQYIIGNQSICIWMHTNISSQQNQYMNTYWYTNTYCFSEVTHHQLHEFFQEF